MHYFKLPYILFRDYKEYGYLTDNRNFGYDTGAKSCVKFGDRILSKTGSVFYSVLSEHPQSIVDLTRRLLPLFTGVSFHEIENDAKEFFDGLVKDGFIGCGESISSSSLFMYSDRTPKFLEEDSSEKEDLKVFNERWGASFHMSRIHLEVSERCNERCVHCYFPDSFRRNLMSKEQFLSILAQCKELNVLNVTISGGEPMLNPELLFFINECRKNNFSINLLSNLTLLTDSLLDAFIQTPMLSVQTSLYSMNADVHDSITMAKGSFEKTIKAIERLYEFNIPMHINCPIMRQNIHDYKEVIKWAGSLNIEASSDYMLFGCFDGSGRNLDCRLRLPEIESLIKEELLTRSVREEALFPSEQRINESDYVVCPVCLNSLCISHCGDVYPCEGWQGYKLGNINDVSLSDIWNNSSAIQELRNLSYDDFPKCSVCLDKEFCSICLLRNYNESSTGDYRELNTYFCSIAHMKRTILMQND